MILLHCDLAAAVPTQTLAPLPSSLATAEVTVGFADPCPLATNPGWPLRNFLWLLGRRKGIRRVTVVAYRELPGKFNINKVRGLAKGNKRGCV